MRSRVNSDHDSARRTPRRALASLLTLSALLLAVVGLTAAPASAAEAGGSSTMTLGTGNTGQALTKQGVRTSGLSPATQGTLAGKRVQITLPLRSIGESPSGDATYAFSGGIRFARGKRKVALRNLVLVDGDPSTSITGTYGDRRFNLFAVSGSPSVDEQAGTMSFRGSRLALVPGAARLIQAKLRVNRVPAGAIGGLAADVRFAFEDPYLDQCGIGAATRTWGQVPPAAPVPELSGPGVEDVSSAITWGIRAGLNGYVNGFARPQGIGGATVNPFPGPPNPAVPPKDYTFVASPGQYAANNPGTLYDDQAVLNSTGGIIYCNTAHGFRITISNPTVVINGSASRIIADVDTNLSADAASGVGDWMPTQRVDLVRLNLSAVTPVEANGEVTWPSVPASLTEAGSSALRLCEVNVPGAPPNCLYPPGTVFDAITVAVDAGSL